MFRKNQWIRMLALFMALALLLAPSAAAKASFRDVNSGAFYADAVSWAVSRQVTNGLDATHFGPNAGCTRGQVVTFLWRAAGCPAPGKSRNPFRDVKKGAFYYDAVLWAVGKGITNGTSATTFSPNATCTRGQIVTFLWRAMGQPGGKKNPYGAYVNVIEGLKSERQRNLNQGDFYYEYLYSNDRGVLYDLDGDGIRELILLYVANGGMSGQSYPAFFAGAYTIRNGRAAELLAPKQLELLVGGNKGYAGVYRLNGKTVLGVRSDEPAGMDLTEIWTFYSMSGGALRREAEVEANRVVYYDQSDYDAVNYSDSYAVFDGVRKSFREYEQWRSSLQTVVEIGGYSESSPGLSYDELIAQCRAGASGFRDADPNAFYYQAMLWAVAAGVTNGTSTTTFSPNATCTRGQVVTFLYRAMRANG